MVLKKPSFQIFLLFIFLLTILGFFIRTSGIFSQNILFLYDNGRDLLYVKQIVIDHKPILIGPSSGGLQGYFHGVWWYYLLAIPFVLGQGNPASFTLFMAIASALSIPVASLILYKITKSYIGAVFIGILYSLSAFSIATSRFIWNPYPIVWLMPLYFGSLFLFSRRKSYALPLLSLLTGIIFSFEAIYGIPLVFSLLIFTFLEILRKTKWQQKIKVVSLSLLLFSLSFLPSLVFDMRHDFLITSSIIKTITTGGSNITHKNTEKPFSAFDRLTLRAQDLYTYTIGSVTDNTALSLTVFAFSFLGFILLLKYRDNQDLLFSALIILTLIVPFFTFLMLKYNVWGYYWIGNTPLYCLFISYLIGKAAKKNTLYRKAVIALIAILFFSLNDLPSLNIWQKGIIDEGSQTLSTQLAIVDKVYQDSGGDPFSVYVLTPPAYDYVYRYLFWWRGNYQYGKFPEKNKQKLTYIIIEPSTSDLQGNYFKEKVVRTNKEPVDIFRFPENVQVKKIIIDQNEEPVDPNYFPDL